MTFIFFIFDIRTALESQDLNVSLKKVQISLSMETALDTLHDTSTTRILTCYLCISPKLPQGMAMPIANPHFLFILLSEVK